MPYGKSEKSEISKEFVKLKKFGYKVINFNSKTRYGSSQAGWVDSIIFNSKYLILLEIKTTSTKDRLSEEQKKTAEMLSAISAINKTVHYRQIRTVEETKKLVENILQNKI